MEEKMNNDVREILIHDGKCCIKKEGKYLEADAGEKLKGKQKHRINIPLFYEIARFTSVRRSYKNVMQEFFDQLQHENIQGFFTTRENLERATMGVGKPGGHIAFMLGLFCRYYGKLPRNVNIVHANCENCGSINCGNLTKCGYCFGCGSGVLNPLDPSFRLKMIPETRRAIKGELFSAPNA
jgi:hypothetical protein